MPRRREPNDPHEWLNRARSSLQHAGSKEEGVYLEDLCFDAQQAAEKAVKAVLVFRRIRFPYVHDLETLLTALSETGEGIPEAVVRWAEEVIATGGG
jgi:HEPN domain-containing protein